ncbi:protein of unknown function [Pseudarcicella hirudinis]|uniref:DUF4290 domain-containing protein n=1 Tax=Pseudarcicella hirudinis TaxID=1079859 RepID=A0A1I5P5U3_9BACT|nr:DUF4290 domain-containing protein [Pseudarcicella hirudinis]SFP29474.1 protein of unknown function [Pseudarcicella hirudinis]
MKEYGTNVQKLVDHILTIQDRDKRTKYAYLLIELMKQVHPNMRDNQDYSNKLWDDLFILSNFQLDVDSPYPPPSPDAVGKRPKSVPYNVHQLKFRHYGRNVELLILRAIAESNPEDKKLLVAHIGKLMKTFYQTWNKEVVDDAVIWEHMREMSENLLAKTIEEVAGASNLGYTRNTTRPNTYSNDSSNERGRGGSFRGNNNDRNNNRNNNNNNDRNNRNNNNNDRNRNNNNNRNNNGGRR